MLRLIVLAVLLLCPVALCTPGEGRIYNGVDADDGGHPYMASLQTVFGWHLCGCSIIHSIWILTAAHCVHNKTASELIICHNATNLNSKLRSVIGVERIVIHEKFVLTAKIPTNDIALLKLKNRLRYIYNRTYRVLLPEQGFEVEDKEAVLTLIGWGRNETGGYRPTQLQQANLKIQDCNLFLSGRTTSDQLCSGIDGGGMGQCTGDSGGPLILKIGNETLQVGVVSWSIKPCGSGKFPGVFTKVSSYVDWIFYHIYSRIAN